MSWIREYDENEAEGEIAAVYARLREQRGKVSNILRVHSLRPQALEDHLALYMGLLFGAGGLTRGEREMVAVVVSRANGCEYCVVHHREALTRNLRDPAQLDHICGDYTAADLDPRQRRMLDYAFRLTRTPSAVTAADIAGLREAGLSDEDILLLNLITAYFNFVNRVALGLGVESSVEEAAGYHV